MRAPLFGQSEKGRRQKAKVIKIQVKWLDVGIKWRFYADSLTIQWIRVQHSNLVVCTNATTISLKIFNYIWIEWVRERESRLDIEEWMSERASDREGKSTQR